LALIKSGANVHAVDLEGKTPLHWCSSARGASAAKALLGFDPALINVQDAYLRTPLHLATGEAAVDTAAVLIRSKGVALDIQDNAERTPLMWAAALGDTPLVEMLVKAGANQYVVQCDVMPMLRRTM
jgi:ankyrin repeat protein